MKSSHSDLVTKGMRIVAAAQYLPQESDPAVQRFVFAYKVTMINEGKERVRLLARHWIILDSNRRREDVRGPGVVGEYPTLGPGETYSYMSYCPLKTSWGTMEGSYTFEGDEGTRFEVGIGRFFLVPTGPSLSLESSI